MLCATPRREGKLQILGPTIFIEVSGQRRKSNATHPESAFHSDADIGAIFCHVSLGP
jgi:hypothetical protein